MEHKKQILKDNIASSPRQKMEEEEKSEQTLVSES